jgi:hypothetical protein
MRKSAYLGLAAAIAVAAAAVSCEGASAVAGLSDDGTSGNYTIKIADGIANGVISANRSAGNKGQTVIVSASPAAASAWEGEGAAPEAGENELGGGGANLSILGI